MSFEDLMQKFGSSGPSELPELPPQEKPGGLEAFVDRFGYAGMTESYWFYNHTVELKYARDPEHRYYKVGELGNLLSVWGVTKSTHIINAAERLVPWAAKVAIAKLLRLVPTETVEGTLRIKPISFEEFTTIALEAKSAHKDKLDEASDIGHMAHKCLEESIRWAIQNDSEKIVRQLINLPKDEQATNAANSAKAWMDAHHVRWVETETKVYSLQHNVAGTTDGMAVCDSCSDRACCREEFKDHLSIIDWKSSNYLNIGYLFQVAFYKSAKQEEFGLDIKDCWINRLGKSEEEAGKFEAWFVPDKDFEEDIAGFLACLHLTQLVEAAEERMKSVKGSTRAIRKEQKATAKTLAKEQEKLKKALEKAEAKRLREIEKQKIKEEAKLNREKLKAEKKAEAIACTSTLNLNVESTPLGSTLLVTENVIQNQITPQLKMPLNESTTSTEEVITSAKKDCLNSTTPSKTYQVSGITYEEEPKFKTIELPGEK